ncbi:MAG: trehalose-phosphatase [Candidatus Methanospirareceae archaeon]
MQQKNFGTLVPFAEKPAKAKPDDELLKLLEMLAKEAKNEVVIVSGRDRGSLEGWFGSLDIGLVAEHGVWIKERYSLALSKGGS